MSPPVWPDPEFADLPPAPESSDPIDVAKFVDARVVTGNRVILKHIDKRFEEVQKQIRDMHKCILSAYPDNDPGAHRRAHEAMMNSAADIRKLKFRVLATTLGATVLGACSFVGFAVMRAAAEMIGKGLP